MDIESNNLKEIINIKLIDRNNSNEVIVTTKYLKEKWEKQSLEEGHKVEYEKFKIIESLDKETNEKYYFLKASSNDKKIQTGAFLIKQGDGFYSLSGKECTCKGCIEGCNLIVEGTNCKCTSCAESGGDCKLTMKHVIQLVD